MSKIVIEGGYSLSGEIRVGGAKNSAVALIPASILCRDEVILDNVPNISDIFALEDILKSLEQLNTSDARNLRNYYNMALANQNIYAKISYINRLIYDRPLSLIQSKSQKQKQLVKVNSMESEIKKVA